MTPGERSYVAGILETIHPSLLAVDNPSIIVDVIKKLYLGCTALAIHADRHNELNVQDMRIIQEKDAEIANLKLKLQKCTSAMKSAGVAVPVDTKENTEYAVLTQEQAFQLRNQKAEYEAQKVQLQNITSAMSELREHLVCPICREVAVLPMVLGACGHIACEPCLRQLDDVAFTSLASNTAGASGRQHLMARRCPECRAEIIGAGFPVIPLKNINSSLIKHKLLLLEESSQYNNLANVQYPKVTVEQRHIAALQLACYAQSQLAQHSVTGVLAFVDRPQWVVGVYILFDSVVSRVFFETFAITLHGKAGGITVLVNTSQRMLAVQLIEKKGEPKTKIPNGCADSHLLIKVATDGRFTFQLTPTVSAAAPKAAGALTEEDAARIAIASTNLRPLPLPTVTNQSANPAVLTALVGPLASNPATASASSSASAASAAATAASASSSTATASAAAPAASASSSAATASAAANAASTRSPTAAVNIAAFPAVIRARMTPPGAAAAAAGSNTGPQTAVLSPKKKY